MKYKTLGLLLLSIASTTVSAVASEASVSQNETSCAGFYQSDSPITDPSPTFKTELLRQPDIRSMRKVLENAHEEQAAVVNDSAELVSRLCHKVSAVSRNACAAQGLAILDKAVSCLQKDIDIKNLRPLATAYMRNEKFLSFILPSVLGAEDQSDRQQVKYRLWRNFHVLVLPAGMPGDWKKDPAKQKKDQDYAGEPDVTRDISTPELLHMEKAYELNRKALLNRISAARLKEFSHLWGSGGVLSRAGHTMYGGEFGGVDPSTYLQLTVTTDNLLGFSIDELAQRIGHESAHMQDQILGYFQSGEPTRWSNSAEARIYKFCGEKPDYETSLKSCRLKQMSWFSFHSKSDYAARNASEFYGKMMDEFVRESLGLVPRGNYRCQNAQTKIFWNEMESHLIGEVLSPPCP